MYNLILVDDEPVVLRGIQAVFHMENFGFHLVKTYTNPLTALKELSETVPDLIITDVKMLRLTVWIFRPRPKKYYRTFKS